MMKAVSVIVPVYNVEQELERCILSLVYQSYKKLEILLIDDGSTDGSREICEKYLKQDLRIKYFRKANGGLSDARNYGIHRMTGEYVLFVDGDDYLELKAIEVLLNTAESGEVDIVCANAIKWEDGKLEKLFKRTFAADEVLSGKDYLIGSIKNGAYTPTVWTALYKSSLIKSNDLLFLKDLLHEDMNWKPKILLAANRVKYIDYRFYHYVIREGSISRQKDYSKNTEHLLWICEDLERHYLQYVTDLSEKDFKVLKNDLAMQYMNAIYLDKNNIASYKNNINKEFLRRNSSGWKVKILAEVFCANPRFYVKIKDLFGKK